jgi:uncharacterized protein
MKCPTCPDTTLTMADRQGIEIDYCAQCRGVWLDRGELDKLMERAITSAPVQAAQSVPRRDFEDSGHSRSSGYARRKKSWMSEIFD